MFHRLGSFLTRNRDAQGLHRVIPLHVHAPACMVAYVLHNRDQALDETDSQNRVYSSRLRFSLKDLQNLTSDLLVEGRGAGGLKHTEVNREYSLHNVLGSHYNTFSIYSLRQGAGSKPLQKVSKSLLLRELIVQFTNVRHCTQILPKDTDLL